MASRSPHARPPLPQGRCVRPAHRGHTAEFWPEWILLGGDWDNVDLTGWSREEEDDQGQYDLFAIFYLSQIGKTNILMAALSSGKQTKFNNSTRHIS